jgi:hypothetical protein
MSLDLAMVVQRSELSPDGKAGADGVLESELHRLLHCPRFKIASRFV